MDTELPPWSEAREHIFIALRPLGFFHALGEAAVLAQRSLPMLAECVALDRGQQIHYVTAAAIRAWEVSPEEVFDVARLNVAGRLDHQLEPVGGGAGEEDPPRLYRCSSGDSFESSRLVSLPILQKMRETLEAPALLCAAPDRDTLLVGTDAAPDLILRLAEAAEACFRESDRPISPALYVFTEDGSLGPLQLVDDHPLRERVRRGHVILAEAEYGAQKLALDARIAEQEVELFVATHFAMEREDAQVFAYATWNEGAPVLLPVVDLVVFSFAEEGRPPLVVPWEVVDGIAGALWEEVESLDPPRRRVLGFPDEAMMAAMSEYAVEL